MKVQIQLQNNSFEFFVDENAESFYGPSFWRQLIEGSFETNQLNSIVRAIGETAPVYFVDLGASTGVYSLLFSPLFRKTFAFEPDHQQYRALRKNVNLNPNLDILIRRAFVTGSNSNFQLSPYAIDSRKNEVNSIDRQDLNSLIKNLNERVLIKMDIEGVEWQIVRQEEFRKTLQRFGSVLFLSPHIGFFYQRRNDSSIEKFKYRLGILREFWILYRLLRAAKLILVTGNPLTPIKTLRLYRRPPGAGFSEPLELRF